MGWRLSRSTCATVVPGAGVVTAWATSDPTAAPTTSEAATAIVRVRARGDQRRREGSPAPDRRADDRSRRSGVTVSGGVAPAAITSGRGATATPVRAAIASHTCAGGGDRGPALGGRRGCGSGGQVRVEGGVGAHGRDDLAEVRDVGAALRAAGDVGGVGLRRGLAQGDQRQHVGVRVLHRPPPDGCAAGRASGGCGS